MKTLITKDSTLTARTSVINGGAATEVDILADGVPVAFKRIGGKWGEKQALREFSKSQKGWTETTPDMLKLVKQLGLIK